MSGVAVAALGIPTYFFAPALLRIFTPSPEAIAFGTAMVKVMMPLYYLQALMQIFSNAVRGFGKSLMVMVLSLLGLVVGRQIFLFFSMHFHYSVNNIYYAYPVGWGLAAVLCIIYYVFTIKRSNCPEQAAAE